MVTGYSDVSVTHSVLFDLKGASLTDCRNYFA